MNSNPTPAIDRIPLAHSVRYVARGLPEVPNQYGPGVLAPSEITLTYRSAPDSGLGRVHAYVAGRIWVDGVELPLLSGGLYGQHYDEGLSNWPEWLAEEARLHDPAAVPAVSAVDQTTRDRIAEARSERYAVAIHDAMEPDLSLVDQEPGMQALFARAAEAAVALADAELAELRRKAAASERIRENADFHLGQEMARRQLAEKETDRLRAELRRLADEAQQPAVGTRQHDTEMSGLPYTHTDDDADTLQIGTVMASTYDGEAPVVFLNVQQHQGDDQATVYVRPERVEEVVTALRAAGRAAASSAVPGRSAAPSTDEETRAAQDGAES